MHRRIGRVTRGLLDSVVNAVLPPGSASPDFPEPLLIGDGRRRGGGERVHERGEVANVTGKLSVTANCLTMSWHRRNWVDVSQKIARNCCSSGFYNSGQRDRRGSR